jgi:hypothetical protein
VIEVESTIVVFIYVIFFTEFECFVMFSQLTIDF